jgi:hypothetical protein
MQMQTTKRCNKQHATQQHMNVERLILRIHNGQGLNEHNSEIERETV